jgi:hypothetical protein
MLFAGILFVLSLLGIVALFALKSWEAHRGSVFFPALRQRADVHALHVKELAYAARVDLEKLPPEMVRLGHVLVHDAALAFAALARAAERGAHRVADLVSHKRHYMPRETRSEFLKKVAEGRNGGLDTTDGNGQNR